MQIAGKTVTLFPSARPGAPLVVLNAGEDEGERVCLAARRATEADFTLAAVGDLNWNDDLTPWPAPPSFKGGAPFGGLADRYLEALCGEILPRIEAALPARPSYAALAGYSLAGLFALYALYRTDAFSRVASASGSLWYPGIVDYFRSEPWVRRPERVYLSLGDKEGRTRNPAMRPVEENTRAVARLCAGAGVPTAFELNPGGHFNAPDERMGRGIAWLVSE